MRITKKDLKHGILRLQPEDADDLWDLNSVIDTGDEVKSSTERKIKLGGSDEKSRVIKRRVTLTIKADKVSYDSTEVRVMGPIIDGPDDMPRGSAHTLSITLGSEITIKKDWPRYQLQRLEDATKQKQTILVVLFDREQALFLNVTGRGVETLVKLKGDVAKKSLDESKKNTFYNELTKLIEEYEGRLKPAGIVLASPAFWQEYVKKHIPNALRKKTTFTTISDVERTAVKELVKRPELQSMLKNNRAALELGYVEEILLALAHDQLAYGDKDVREAINMGNAKAIFLTETRITKEREKEIFAQTERLLRAAESADAAVHIVSSEEAARKIDGLGGLVVLQRWKT